MNSKITGVLAALLVLAGSVSLLQWHGILFWTDKVGPHGWAWSLLLEAIALWLWYKPKLSFRLLALVASVLTLAGPTYQVAKPSIEAHYAVSDQSNVKQAQLVALNNELAQLQRQLEVYQANSLNRTGWLSPIEKANERIIEVNRQIVSLAGSINEDSQWFFSWEVAMEIISLILFQVVAVLSITTISKQLREMTPTAGGVVLAKGEFNGGVGENNPPMEIAKEGRETTVMETEIVVETTMETTESYTETTRKPMETNKEKSLESPYISRGLTETEQATNSQKPEEILMTKKEIELVDEQQVSTEMTMEITRETITENIEEIGSDECELDPLQVLADLTRFTDEQEITFKQFSAMSGVSAKELSFLRNHEKRVASGERTVSLPALERINMVVFGKT